MNLTLTDARLSEAGDLILLAIAGREDDSEVYTLSEADAQDLHAQLHAALKALARRQASDAALAESAREMQPNA